MLKNLPEIYKFSTVNRKVEDRLTQKPLRIPGCGLPKNFKYVFLEEEVKKPFQNINQVYNSPKSHQIYLETKAIKSTLRHKKDEQMLFDELKYYLKNLPKNQPDKSHNSRSKSILTTLGAEDVTNINM